MILNKLPQIDKILIKKSSIVSPVYKEYTYNLVCFWYIPRVLHTQSSPSKVCFKLLWVVVWM